MATPDDVRRRYLEEQISLAEKAASALRFSFDRAQMPPVSSDTAIPPEEAERLEALSARFARLSDILVQKVFRAIDAVELVDEGSLLDRLARMEKRGVIDSADTWRRIRALRNQIAHDYVLKDLRVLYRNVWEFVPTLFSGLALSRQCADDLAKKLF
jgi:uncharacterized protein YutE (UPF0331/DUF86 family)